MNNGIKPRVLLLDDRLVHRDGGVVESKFAAFADRLATQEGFATNAPPAVDDRGFSLQDASLDDVATVCRSWIDDFEAGALVIDMDWWGNDEYGEELWKAMKGDGLAIDPACVVFLTMFVAPDKRSEIASRNDLSPLQVNYKDTTGYNTAAKWLVDHL